MLEMFDEGHVKIKREKNGPDIITRLVLPIGEKNCSDSSCIN